MKLLSVGAEFFHADG